MRINAFPEHNMAYDTLDHLFLPQIPIDMKIFFLLTLQCSSLRSLVVVRNVFEIQIPGVPAMFAFFFFKQVETVGALHCLWRWLS